MIRFDLNNAYGWTLYRQQEVDIHQEQVDIEQEVDIEVVDTVLLMVQEDELLSVVQPCCTSQVGLPILSGYQIGVHGGFYSSKDLTMESKQHTIGFIPSHIPAKKLLTIENNGVQPEPNLNLFQ